MEHMQNDCSNCLPKAWRSEVVLTDDGLTGLDLQRTLLGIQTANFTNECMSASIFLFDQL